MNAFLQVIEHPSFGFVAGYIIMFIYIKQLRNDVTDIKNGMIWKDTYESDNKGLSGRIKDNKEEIDRLRNGKR